MAKANKAEADKKLQEAYNLYGNLIVKYCTVRLKEDTISVDDCVQNTFLVYYNKLLDGSSIENPKAFLYRTADNMVKRALADYYKKAKRTVVLEEAENIPAEDTYAAPADLDYDYLKAILLEKLSPEEQLLYRQKYTDRLSLKEIGEQYQISPTAVANRTSRLRAKIKLLINDVIENNSKGGNLT
ncbi:MAG: sigma-70 family RNA polymerase sigma factor [Clostridium sp.]|nr:sigma-70 family RNA polymerase sigma factor [Clostridium sp.]